MKRILIVGKNFSGLSNYLKENEYDYLLLCDVLATKFPDKRLKRRVVADFSSKESVLAAVDSLEGSFDGVMTIYENYIVVCAWVAERLSLPGMPPQSAEACTDKELMRQLFSKAPRRISPGFQVVNTKDELAAFAEAHSFPLILKPANLAKSLLVTKNHDLAELLANYDTALSLFDSTYKKYAPNRTPKLIVEEFMEGSIHSVDAFVDAAGVPHVLEQIVDYQTGYDIGYDDNFHYSRLLPSRLSAADQRALREVAVLGCQALGMKSSPAHIEIIMTTDGPRIVEIGARNGGYRERMHAIANGINIPGNALALALGKQPDLASTKNESCAVLELFPKIPGKFVELANEEALRQLPSLNYLSIKATPESFVGKSSDGHKMTAVIILHNSDSTVFEKDLDYINEHVFVQTKES